MSIHWRESKMQRFLLFLLAVAIIAVPVAASADDAIPPWVKAAQAKGPMTADEARAFIKRLAKYVEENHLKHNADSPQRGMIYEYFDTTRKGEIAQFVQGEALDTMHDGAWYCAAMI